MTAVGGVGHADVLTRLADKLETTTRGGLGYPTPGVVARLLDGRIVQTPALELIDDLLLQIAEGHITRLIVSVPPQEGKSQRISRAFLLWMLLRDHDLRLGVASYELSTARRWGRTVRNDIRAHPDFGLTVSRDSSAASEWTLAGDDVHGSVYSVGIGGALTGRPLDGLIIDDPVKDRAQAESQTYRDTAWEWWTDVARTRLAPGGWVVIVMTRWHEDDLAGRLIAQDARGDGEGWTVVNIPAQADHDPHKGERDPLGREPGEWLRSAGGRTPEQWQQIRAAVGTRTFTSLYQGRPSPVEGDLFKRSQWRRYDTPRAFLREDGTWHCPAADQVIQSWDMAFKDTKHSDYVVGQVWARFGLDAYLLDQVRARLSFTATVEAVRELTRRWPQATAKLIEDKANGSAVIDQLKRSITGLIPITPKDGKYVRAVGVSPYVESGHVHLPSDRLASWAAGFIDEAAAFPNGTHDDQVDAMTQALDRLLARGGGKSTASSARGRGTARMPAVAGIRLPR